MQCFPPSSYDSRLCSAYQKEVVKVAVQLSRSRGLLSSVGAEPTTRSTRFMPIISYLLYDWASHQSLVMRSEPILTAFDRCPPPKSNTSIPLFRSRVCELADSTPKSDDSSGGRETGQSPRPSAYSVKIRFDTQYYSFGLAGECCFWKQLTFEGLEPSTSRTGSQFLTTGPHVLMVSFTKKE